MENIASFPAGKMRKGAGKRSRSLSASGRLCHAQFYAAALVRLHDHGVALVELAVDDQRRERFLDVVDLVWALADLFNGLMAVPNLLALLALSGVVVAIDRK